MSTTLESMLSRTTDVCGGRLRIDGTRFTVAQVATLYRQGLSAEDIAREHPHIPLEGIYAALAYYLANRDEIDAELVAEDSEYEKLKSGR